MMIYGVLDAVSWEIPLKTPILSNAKLVPNSGIHAS